MNRGAIGLVLGFLASPAIALDLTLPAGARITVERNTVFDSFDAPVGVFANDAVPSIPVEGAINRVVWRIDSPGLTPLQVMAPLREQIRAAGYEVLFECAALACGGFDFRFAVEVLPGPNMYVNMRAYRYLTALRGPRNAPDAVISVLSSTSTTSAFVQVIETGRVSIANVPSLEIKPSAIAVDISEFIDSKPELLVRGHVVLRDLEFGTGSSDLGTGPFASLDGLAAMLAEQPGLRIALVGHTDSVGGLDANIALSRKRAQSVRQRLIDAYGVRADRLEAEGMGYLAPISTNQTADGRDANRRVEAIVLNTD